MKKLFFIGFFFIIVLFGISAQSLRDYTLLTAGNIGDSGSLSSSKYAVPCEIITTTIQGQTLNVVEGATLNGRTLMSFEMTAEQLRQRDVIRSEKDMPLVLFTRRGSNRDNYRFVVDRLIPLKNVFGVVTGNLPKTFNTSDFFAVLELYIQNPKIDPDGRVANKIEQDRQAAISRENQIRAAEERSAERARQRELNDQKLQQEQAIENERLGRISKATIHSGYKPCFGTGNKFLLEYEKIAVYGFILNSSITSMMNPTLDQDIKIMEASSIIQKIGHPRNASSQSFICIFFLSKSSRDYYTVDDFLLFDNISNGKAYDNNFMDDWILENVD